VTTFGQARTTAHAAAIDSVGATACLLLGLQLRPTTTSTGACLPWIETGTGMSPALSSALVATPVLCFALGGWLAWVIRRQWGGRHAITGALFVLSVALILRPVGGAFLLWGGTIAASLAIAVVSTVLPATVKSAPAGEQGRLNMLWTSGLGAGSAAGALVTGVVLVPALGWRGALASWGLFAGIALAYWIAGAKQFPEPQRRQASQIGPMSLHPRWPGLTLMVHFGLLTGISFTLMGFLPDVLLAHTGVGQSTMWWMFSAAMSVGVPLAPKMTRQLRTARRPAAFVVLVGAPTMVGILVLQFGPTGAVWVGWVCSIAIGMGLPSVVVGLNLIGARAADADSAAALSSLVQGGGYVIAGAVSLGVGLLHAATGSWTWPLWALVAIAVGQAVSGAVAGRRTVVGVGNGS
jgi:CP family cyanate transporter-like MFS transporter